VRTKQTPLAPILALIALLCPPAAEAAHAAIRAKWSRNAVDAAISASRARNAVHDAISSNWSGYAIHEAGVSYSRITGTWRLPSADCASAAPAYSAAWVGIGGYRLGSSAIEQVGTETDCTNGGAVRTSAWYELVPDPSHVLRLTVRPGDAVRATVSVAGQRVTLTLRDLTRRRGVMRRLTAPALDRSSAEWIVEAPSRCRSRKRCRTLPLADFGSVDFSGARARDSGGAAGPIGSRGWTHTRITLAAPGPSVPPYERQISGAVPSALSASGGAFRVAFLGQTLTFGPGPRPPSAAG
jgi:hypothetical protein